MFFCIPVALIGLLLFHRVLKFPLLSLLPDKHRNILARTATAFPWRRFLLVVVSLLIGSLTHLAWDSFTHERGLVVSNVSLLKVAVLQTPYGAIRVFKLLQHGSTIAGCGALIFWYSRWSKRQAHLGHQAPLQIVARTRPAVIWVLAVCSAATGFVRGYIGSRGLHASQWAHSFANRSVLAAISALFIGLMLFSLFWHLKAVKNTLAADSGKSGRI
jgi:hypothetical protein